MLKWAVIDQYLAISHKRSKQGHSYSGRLILTPMYSIESLEITKFESNGVISNDNLYYWTVSSTHSVGGPD